MRLAETRSSQTVNMPPKPMILSGVIAPEPGRLGGFNHRGTHNG
jgi:hypothetical protein